MLKNQLHFILSITKLLSIIGVLLLAGCDNNNDVTMIEACKKGRLEEAVRLLNEGADINATDKDGNTALKWAIYYRHLDVVKFLLHHGADVNPKNKDGHTALMATAYVGFPEATKLVLERGADIDTEDLEGKTALDWAVIRGHEEVKEILLKHGAKE